MSVMAGWGGQHGGHLDTSPSKARPALREELEARFFEFVAPGIQMDSPSNKGTGFYTELQLSKRGGSWRVDAGSTLWW